MSGVKELAGDHKAFTAVSLFSVSVVPGETGGWGARGGDAARGQGDAAAMREKGG